MKANERIDKLAVAPMHGVREQPLQLFYRICLDVWRNSLDVCGSAIELLPLKVASWSCEHIVSDLFTQKVLKNIAQIVVR